MNEEEYQKFKKEQEGLPIRSKVFKHKLNGNYETQISILEMGDYEEVEE